MYIAYFTYLLGIRCSCRLWLNLDGYTKHVPTFDVSNVNTVWSVESDDHGVFECLASFLTFVVISFPSKEFAHGIELFRHVSLMVASKIRVLREGAKIAF